MSYKKLECNNIGRHSWELCDGWGEKGEDMKKVRISTWVYIIGIVLLVCAFVFMQKYCSKESHQLRTYEFTEDNLSAPQDGIVLSMSISKQWEDDELHPYTPWGAQYDGILTNTSDYTFKNWTAEIELSDDTLIDSSWNGKFAANGEQLSFIAQGDPATVASQGYATFGAILYASELMTVNGYRLSGYRIVHLQDLLIARILMVILFFWVVAFIMHIIIYLKTKSYKVRQELDQKIIDQSMNMFTGFIDAKDSYTRGHSARVAEYSQEIGRRLKMSSQELRQLYQIALMHDCGKIGIPDSVLKKPGP